MPLFSFQNLQILHTTLCAGTWDPAWPAPPLIHPAVFSAARWRLVQLGHISLGQIKPFCAKGSALFLTITLFWRAGRNPVLCYCCQLRSNKRILFFVKCVWRQGFGTHIPGLYVSVTDIKFPLRTQAGDQIPLVGPPTVGVITTGYWGHLGQGIIIVFYFLLGILKHRNSTGNFERNVKPHNNKVAWVNCMNQTNKTFNSPTWKLHTK